MSCLPSSSKKYEVSLRLTRSGGLAERGVTHRFSGMINKELPGTRSIPITSECKGTSSPKHS